MSKRQSHTYLMWIVLCAACSGWQTVHAEDPVYFADANLKAAVEAALGKTNPTPTDMLGLTSLSAWRCGIVTLIGLEYAPNLRTLDLDTNQISDLSALSGLTSLQSLRLSSNRISDLSPLSGLTNLDCLSLDENLISGLSPLSGLTNLTVLDLSDNRISDLSSLSGLTNLTTLPLRDNQISDLSALSGLTNLIRLYLDCNQISSLSPVTTLTNLMTLTLNQNQISNVSPLSGLTNLRTLFLSSNRISHLSPLLGLTRLQDLSLETNPLDRDAYCSDLPQILNNNPDISLHFDRNANPPGGINASDGAYADKVRVTWDALCTGPGWTDAFRYMVYRSTSVSGAKQAISAWLDGTSFDDATATPGVHYCYWVKSDTSGDDYSDPDEGWHAPLQRRLTIDSAAGGAVASPGEGTFTCDDGTVVILEAKADPLFEFVGWWGSVFDNSNPCSLTVDADYTITAHFESLLDVLYVDDDAPRDPGAGDPNVSDPNENGTIEHPFDSVQEAIDVAGEAAKVIVRSGTYLQTIDLLGKSIEVNGLNEDDPNITSLPVIDGSGKDTVVRCTQGEDPNCVLRGLVIVGGKGRLAGGIVCLDSRPTILNCLIVGNRATDPDGGGGIQCRRSNATFVNCTVSGNCGGSAGAGVILSDSGVAILNSIVWANVPSQIEAIGSDHSVVAYTAVAGGWPGTGNLDADPRFVMPGYWASSSDGIETPCATDLAAVWMSGDYHLMSRGGRWDVISGMWITDAASSPCIDAGDPDTPVGQEPMPNGGRINLGVYGGTDQAGMSHSDG